MESDIDSIPECTECGTERTPKEQVAWTLFFTSAWALSGHTAVTSSGVYEMNNIGIHEETPLDRAIVRQDSYSWNDQLRWADQFIAKAERLEEENRNLWNEVQRLKAIIDSQASRLDVNA